MKITIECECGNKECGDTTNSLDIEIEEFFIYNDREGDKHVLCLKCNKDECIEMG